MAAIQPIVITDSTQKTVTFDPAKINDDFALWEDRSAPVYLGYAKVSMQYKRPTGTASNGATTRYRKPTIKIDIPYVVRDAETGVYSLASREFATVEFAEPTSNTAEQNQYLLDVVRGVLGHQVVTNMVVNGEFVW